MNQLKFVPIKMNYTQTRHIRSDLVQVTPARAKQKESRQKTNGKSLIIIMEIILI